MRTASHGRISVMIAVLSVVGCGLLSGCTHAIPRWGTAGRYLEGRDQFLRGRGGDMQTAVNALESVVGDDPTYKDSLTLLGRAYYRQARYQDAIRFLQRAVAVNEKDEIAWLVIGLTQLRLGEDEKGVETLKGAITLVSKASVRGYRDFPEWDSKGVVRTYISRSVVQVIKGVEEKEKLMQTVETLLARMDDEENFQRINAPRQRLRDSGG